MEHLLGPEYAGIWKDIGIYVVGGLIFIGVLWKFLTNQGVLNEYCIQIDGGPGCQR